MSDFEHRYVPKSLSHEPGAAFEHTLELLDEHLLVETLTVEGKVTRTVYRVFEVGSAEGKELPTGLTPMEVMALYRGPRTICV